ncbi:MAG: aldo/keto reductase [Gammaproteobacteria bacterium]|nr:aldo/keto reductase [Gammaproteobacteria bacterium]|tara:strand:+ start:550 stop:1449 length:900 start_codon:yes stop_codon:yes gene_type:complete
MMAVAWPENDRMIEKRLFGRTGHWSTATIFGAAALKNVNQSVADNTLDVLLEYGVNHIDTAPAYGDAEKRVGPWMSAHRDQFFLATKTRQRTYAQAKFELHRSLERLRVDQVDLIQMHALYHPDEWDTAMADGGALQALIEAREEGLVRFIGVTGHGWTIAAMHRRSLERFDFDSVLLPYTPSMQQNERYAREFEWLLSTCCERGVAVQTIKAVARGPWAGREETYNTWYQPLDRQWEIDQAVHWALERKEIFLNTVGDVSLLPKVLDAAARYSNQLESIDINQLQSRGRLSSLFGIGT